MHRSPGIAVTRTLGLSVPLLGLLLALALPTAPSALAAGDVNEGTCPNEANTGFTSALPDCRAYEQVSPAFKNGFGESISFLFAGGEQVGFESVGLFAGATPIRNCAISNYHSVRTASGWTTMAVNDVPPSQFSYAGKSCNPELIDGEGASLSQLRPVSGSVYARDLYIHQPNGAFEEVGPMLSLSAGLSTPTGTGEAGDLQPLGANFTDATPDLSHVLFTLGAQDQTLPPGVATELWPDDTTHLNSAGEYVPSLYEYVGTGNTTPTLVGVDNSGHLISDCATTPGGWSEGGNGNYLNVISESGSRVFFTAIGEGEPINKPCVGTGGVPPVNELFARVNSGQPQSLVDAQGRCTVAADACTVAISQPRALSPSAPDTGCSSEECLKDITEQANFRDANYEKASRNGSKVFFTSTQQLLNNATQDSNPDDSAAPRGPGEFPDQKGCGVAPLSTGTRGPNGCNLYEYDLEENPVTGRPVGLVLVSGGDTSGLGPEVQGVAAVSEDGSHVYFVAKGVLTREPRAGSTGPCIAELSSAELAVEEATYEGRCRPKRGADNLYVFDTETHQTNFVATLSEADAVQWVYNATGRPMNVTDDGGFLVFTSSQHLTTGDNSSVQQVFRYEATTGALVRVSLGNEGYEGLGASEISSRKSLTDIASEPLDGDSHPAVSEDGRIVVFKSSEALVPGAPTDNVCASKENGQCTSYVTNVYEYREGHVYLLAGGAAEEPPRISQSERNIFFLTPGRLVSQDGDSLNDIYDARVDGGFPSPATITPCSEEGCQGSVSAPPAFGAPASASLTGSGNLVPLAPAVAPKPKAKPLTRAQKLANALHACRQKRKKARTSCESAAHRKYGAKAKKSNSDWRPGR